MARLVHAAAVVAFLIASAPAARAQQADSVQDLRTQGNAHLRAGRVDEAATAFQRALALLETTPGPALASLLHEYGWVEFQRSGQDAADQLWARGEAIAAASGDAVGRVRLSLSRVLVTPPGPARLQMLETGLAEARRLELPEVEAGYLQRLGEQQMWDGRYLEAARTLRQAGAGYEAIGRLDLAGRALGPLGRLYRKHGRADLALAVQQRALALLEKHGSAEDRAWALAGISSAEAALGRTGSARRHIEEALAIAKGTRRTHDQIQLQEAFLALQTGGAARAARITRRILESGDPFAARLAWHPHAEALLALGRPAEALEAIERAIDLSIEPSELPRMLLLRARSLASLKRHQEALATVRDAITAVERVRSDLIALDGLKQGYALFVEALFDFAVGLQVDLGMPRQALDSAEHGRSRAFLDLLRSRRDAAALGEIERAPAAQAGPDDIASVASAEAGDSDDYVDLARTYRSTMLVYWVAPERSFVWSVKPDGAIAVTRIAAGSAAIEQLARQAMPAGSRRPLETVRGEPSSASQPVPAGVLAGATARTAWTRLFDMLVRPVASALPAHAGARLTIVPHGPVAAVPFGAFIDERQRYLIERFEIHYLPAGAAAVTAPAADRPARAGVFVVGPPATFPAVDGPPLPRLPGALREVRDTAARFPGADARIVMGRDARERDVRRAMADSAVLHFATHAVVSDDAPLDGFLALEASAGAALDDDGRLTLREIYGLRVNAELVVLSACRTAAGRAAADGVTGFARAFLSAGVRRVVGGLWDVPDLTSALLMRGFYSGEDRGTAAALRRGQLNVLRAMRAGTLTVQVEGRTVTVPEDPSLWAGFVLLGQP